MRISASHGGPLPRRSSASRLIRTRSSRIALGGVNVSVVNDQNNTVQVWGFDPCPPGKYCGAGSVTTTVVWDGSPKPTPGDVISLYGVTITSSLRIDGSVKIGWCHPEWGC